MSTARWLTGDAGEVLSTLASASVDLVLTSWPYLAVRSYLPTDHPDKLREMGAEPSPAAFLDRLLAVTAELRRVLAPHGTLCAELGDTYAGSGGAGGDYGSKGSDDAGWRAGQPRFTGSARTARSIRDTSFQGSNTTTGGGPGWPLDKSLTMVPELYRVALAYGLNPLTGVASPAGLWRVRNVVVHARPNPPVGALGDKFRPACSYWAVACTSRSRYFDLEAVRSAPSPNTHTRTSAATPERPNDTKVTPDGHRNTLAILHADDGAPPLDWHAEPTSTSDMWVMPSTAYAGPHYAVFSPRLVARFVRSMCPQRVCRRCGAPSRRIVKVTRPRRPAAEAKLARPLTERFVRPFSADPPATSWRYRRSTAGWSGCECLERPPDWRRGVVLDPFAGSGTTGHVATGHGRDAILIDLDERNEALAQERIGMLMADALDP